MHTSLTHADVQKLAEKALQEAKSSVSWWQKIRTRWSEWLSLTADGMME